MAIIGTHCMFYSTEPEALRAQIGSVFGWKSVDAGGGWLIFALPPAELGVHPGDGPTFDIGVRHQVSLMCDDINATIKELRAKGVKVDGEPQTQSYGITVSLQLAGGVEVLLYQPRHASPLSGIPAKA